ncbi:MAG TPA: NAD(P)/FAD-dependent oxidoreductase [Bryobacteraceae bacterium]|nr:NAD(P)/FAD-dependent oxidoreductase [Bryobacteraceae bacterium]
MAERFDFDVIVVGGGPAGLSAATVLARSRRRVLVCDAGDPRNVRSRGIHGFLSREGVLPLELLAIAREQIGQYGVEFSENTVMRIAGEAGRSFHVTLLDGREYSCRRILLATGVIDKVPEIPGTEEMYGISVHHCPYCDGWEHRDEPIAVYGRTTEAAKTALAMLTWSKDMVLCTDGGVRFRGKDKARLQKHGIEVYEERIQRLSGTAGKLSEIVFRDGSTIRRSAMFFVPEPTQRSTLPVELGCRLNHRGAVETGRDQCSSVPGVYVVGDASQDAQFVAIAAAEGTKAGMSINKELQKEELAD